jgi:hypothetical protein
MHRAETALTASVLNVVAAREKSPVFSREFVASSTACLSRVISLPLGTESAAKNTAGVPRDHRRRNQRPWLAYYAP